MIVSYSVGQCSGVIFSYFFIQLLRFLNFAGVVIAVSFLLIIPAILAIAYFKLLKSKEVLTNGLTDVNDTLTGFVQKIKHIPKIMQYIAPLSAMFALMLISDQFLVRI